MNCQRRRSFVKKAFIGCAGFISLGCLPFVRDPLAATGNPGMSRGGGGVQPAQGTDGSEAMFYSKLDNNVVQCQLCPHRCKIEPGNSGFCRVRRNRRGTLYSMVYGRPCTVDVGPIEKAPLYHFVPGHRRLCLATVGCNLRCRYCHNWHISQRGPGEVRELRMSASQIVDEAARQGVRSISFTYSEPTIFYEYVYDISRLAKDRGLKTSIVSNGYINPEPMRRLLPHLDAVKIDLKAFSDSFYRDISSASLDPVLRTLQLLREEGAFFEIVCLVVPTLNDDPVDIKMMCEWIAGNLGRDVPLHFTRFAPSYRLTNLPSTPVRTLEAAIGIALGSGLRYVYIGNVPGHMNNSTYCPRCDERLIHRTHFTVLENNIENGKCRYCGYAIRGIWEAV